MRIRGENYPSNWGIRWSFVSAREQFSPSSLETLSDNSGGLTGQRRRPEWVSVIVSSAPCLLAKVFHSMIFLCEFTHLFWQQRQSCFWLSKNWVSNNSVHNPDNNMYIHVTYTCLFGILRRKMVREQAEGTNLREDMNSSLLGKTLKLG